MKAGVKWFLGNAPKACNPIFMIFCFCLLFPMLWAVFTNENSDDMPHHEVEHWAQGIGNHVFHLLNLVARYQEIEQNFRDEKATISESDGLFTVKQMAEDVSNMMKYKVQAVKRIMNVAEEVSQDPSYLQDEWKGYYNAKIINQSPDFVEELEKRYNDRLAEYYGTKFKEIYTRLDLTPNSHFEGIPISLNASTVHVPTSVFDGAPHVRRAIRWSEALEKTFYSNYEHDPTLSWQFFGSATGFLRQFPGAAWQMDAADPDLYDARFRSWYIQAANSPKDMVILLDVSGSMTGIRKEISKHVVLNILETLNENDYVNIFTFSEFTVPLVDCFNDTLVQANLENIGHFKKGLEDITTKNIANFSRALTRAFQLLQKHNKAGHGTHCNQAIMLITDGAPYTYDNVFDKYNWPHLQIRLFTYLIGREVTEVRSLRWMACANKGYFVHVTTASEVREQVLKYIPVVARPMVMYQDKHPIIWTGVYADIADPKQTKWLWELRERDRQMRRTNNYRKLKRLVESRDYEKYQSVRNDKTQIEKFLLYGEFQLSDREIARIKAERAKRIRGPYSNRRKKRMVLYYKGEGKQIKGNKLDARIARIHREMDKLEKLYRDIRMGRRESPFTKHGYRLMTTVSVPVFNKTLTANITERVLINDSVWIIRSREKRVADLLGVAGADVPIREIEKLVPPYKLGVNGYSFMVNKNGYILYHPDMRPTFQDILKPNYNSVDLAEVELVDVSDDPRQNHSELNTLRRDMIEQRNSEAIFTVRIHLDNMKRVEVRKQRYFTFKISETPFSLGIAIPEGYGRYKVKGEIELSLAMKDNVNFNGFCDEEDTVNCTQPFQDSRPSTTDFFSSGNWSLHPDWVYCEYKYDQGIERSPEELMLHFLVKAQMPGWKWRSTRTKPPPDSTQPSKGQHYHYDESDYYCDKTLVQSLLFDAKVTDVYNNSNQKKKIEEKQNNGKHKNFGITNAFVATRSGLSRWIDVAETDFLNLDEEPHFMKIHNRAIDEVWYKRAVDYYKEDPEAYVYSVPFDAATRDPSEVLITASRAIFIKENKFKLAPAAVVGVNIKLDKFVEFFKNKTYECREYSVRQMKCKKDMTCRSSFLDCYILDDNGFIVASEKAEQTGKFFGEIEGTIMESLVQSDMYNRVKIYDYQAVCLDDVTEGNFASVLLTPVELFKWAMKWVMGNIMWFLMKTQLYQLWDPNQAYAYSNYGTEGDNYPDYSHFQGNADPGNPGTFSTVTDQGRRFEKARNYHVSKSADYQYVSDDAVSVEYISLNESEPETLNKTRYNEAPDKEEKEKNQENGKKEGEVDDVEKEGEVVEENINYDEENSDPGVVGNDWSHPIEEEEEGFPKLELAYINKKRPRPCDKEVNLYKLNNNKLKETKSDKFKPVKGKLSNCHSNGCGKPFSIQKVVKSNLVLIVVHNLCPCESKVVGVNPIKTNYSGDRCKRLLQKHFRQRPDSCYNYHPDETSINDCGGSSRLPVPAIFTLLLLAAMHMARLRQGLA